MPIVLPTEVTPVQRIDPKILVLYGKPKVGKTELLSKLKGCLTIDSEDGSDYFEMLKIKITRAEEIDEVFEAIMTEGRKRAKEGKTGLDLFPYKYIAVDTADALEDMCERSATKKYKNSTIGKSFDGDTVLELPKGSGYYYLRNELMSKLMMLTKVCKGLIIVAHIREKNIDKGGTEVTTKDLSLTGKISQLVCAKADAIGYVYRDRDEKEVMVSFETLESSAIMGARAAHLRGVTMPFNWDKIFIDQDGKS